MSILDESRWASNDVLLPGLVVTKCLTREAAEALASALSLESSFAASQGVLYVLSPSRLLTLDCKARHEARHGSKEPRVAVRSDGIITRERAR